MQVLTLMKDLVFLLLLVMSYSLLSNNLVPESASAQSPSLPQARSLDETMIIQEIITINVSSTAEESFSLSESFEIMLHYNDGRTETLHSMSSVTAQPIPETDDSRSNDEFVSGVHLSRQVREPISLIDNVQPITVQEAVKVPTSANLAVSVLRDAEAAGANVSELVHQFNKAIDLLRQAEESDFDSCISRDECIDSADTIFESVAKDAQKLSDEGNTSVYQRLLSPVVYAVIISFGMSLGILYIYKHYKSYQLRKFLEMHVATDGGK